MHTAPCSIERVLNLEGVRAQNIREDITSKNGVAGRIALYSLAAFGAVGRCLWRSARSVGACCQAGAVAARDAARKRARVRAEEERLYEIRRSAEAAAAGAAGAAGAGMTGV